MTNPHEFRNQTKPGDWVIPAGFEEMLSGYGGVDPVTLSLFKEGEFSGVPVPFAFQSIEEMTGQLERLDAGEDPAAVATEMVASFAEKEQRYPDTAMWDHGRSGAVRAFLEQGHIQAAGQLLGSFNDARRATKTVLELSSEEVIEPDDAVDLLCTLIDGKDRERSVAVARTARDDIIENDPSSELVATYNGILGQLLGQPDFDWTEDWIESQTEAHPEINWDFAGPWLRDDAAYAGMPMAQRMYNYLRLMETMLLINDGGMDADLAADIVEHQEDVREGEYGDAKIFDRELGSLAKALVEKGDVDTAEILAAGIHDPDVIGMMLAELADKHEQEAIELAVRNPDPKMTAILLLGVEFRNDAGMERLVEIIRSDEYTAERRIGCLEVVRDRTHAMGDADKAAEYQDMIDAISE